MCQEKQIYALVSQKTGLAVKEVDGSTDLDRFLSPVEIVELICLVEADVGVEIPFASIHTVDDLIKYARFNESAH